MDHYTEEPDSAKTCCLYSNASYAQLPLLEWCNVHCYSVSTLLRTHGYLYGIQVINYYHRIVQVAIYSTP